MKSIITDTLFVLGADDPEMIAIKEVLEIFGAPYVLATHKGVRVSPATAYDIDEVSADQYGWAIFIECQQEHMPMRSGIIDHHNPEHPGYMCEPSQYMQGSSLGQLLSYLARCSRTTEDLKSFAKVGDHILLPSKALNENTDLSGDYMYDTNYGVLLKVHTPDCLRAYAIFSKYLYIAAADHCLAAAYKDYCFGVKRADLLRFRAREKAKFQTEKSGKHIKEEDVILNIVDTSLVLITRRQDMHEAGIDHEPIDMTDAEYPELPEAASYVGAAYIAKVKEPNEKYVLGGNANSRMVEQFITHFKKRGFKVYGNPVRGYAGAYDNQNQETK